MEKLIVDRIVGSIVVLEKSDKSHIDVPIQDISLEINEGSVLLFDGEKYYQDKQEEQERRSRVFSLQEKLKNKNKGE